MAHGRCSSPNCSTNRSSRPVGKTAGPVHTWSIRYGFVATNEHDSWVVRWRTTGAEADTSRAWDNGTTGVADLGHELLAGFDDLRRATAFAASVAGTVEQPAPWTGPEPTDIWVGGVTIRIDAGSTFGHGSHPTTALLLDWLAISAHSGTAGMQSRTVLDVGSGSGVLSVAAAALGATVSAIDIDTAARDATAANAAANHVDVEVIDQQLPIGRRFDVVLANMLLADQRAIAGHIAAAAASTLVVSGFLVDQVDAVVGLYPGFAAEETATGPDGWVRLELRRG